MRCEIIRLTSKRDLAFQHDEVGSNRKLFSAATALAGLLQASTGKSAVYRKVKEELITGRGLSV
jgi:hypothetical protein